MVVAVIMEVVSEVHLAVVVNAVVTDVKGYSKHELPNSSINKTISLPEPIA